MRQRFLPIVTLLCGLGTSASLTAATARTMYTDALAREQKARAALSAPEPDPAVVDQIHAIVAAYESLVRRYPTSGYSDNALWQAGRLELDAFAAFGDAADKERGVRLLRRLAANYPTSKLVAQVPDVLAASNGTGPSPLAAKRSTATRQPDPPPPSTVAPPAAAPARAVAEANSSAARLTTIKDIRRTVLADAVRITIELDGEVPFHDERISDPSRVFVDFSGTRAAPGLVDRTLRFAVDADIVRQVRIGRHPNNTTRVVLDADGVTSYSVYPLYGPFRLVIDCVRPPAATTGVAAAARAAPPAAVAAVLAPARPSPPPPAVAPALAPAKPTPPPVPPLLTARSLTRQWPRRLPSTTPRASALLKAARDGGEVAEFAGASAPITTPAPPLPAKPVDPALTAHVAPPPNPAATNATGGLSIARQLGLGVSRIVIDAGHGGHDPGAKGRGVNEAELVLDVALRLEKLLQRVAGVEVILTRRTDDFVALPERTAIANREGADLFLSIHANASSNPQAHGVETYFLNFANNVSAAAIAARENATSTLAMGEMPDIVKAIAMSNKVDESRDFASHVQRAMAERLKTSNKLLKDLGVKQAPFVVLIGATMPAVLAEISFVTNPQEAKLLKNGAYRQRIAESLFNAIRKYQTSLKGASTVALQ